MGGGRLRTKTARRKVEAANSQLGLQPHWGKKRLERLWGGVEKVEETKGLHYRDDEYGRCKHRWVLRGQSRLEDVRLGPPQRDK